MEPSKHPARFVANGVGTTLTIDGVMTGDEARAIRQGLKMSARELAETLGATESTIYRWENRRGRSVPRLFEHALLHVVALRANNGGRKAAAGE